MNPLTRDGHLSDLGVELVLAEDLDREQQAQTEAHLASCDSCSARLEAARTDEGAPLPELRRTPPPANRPWPLLALGLVAAAAVAAALVGLPVVTVAPADLEGIRLKGPGLALELVADDPTGQRTLTSGDEVHPGDRLGFKVGSAKPGHVMVVEVDSAGRVSPCFPQSGGTAAPFAVTDGLRPLPEAVRLDATLGESRFVALRCEQSFGLEDVREALASGASVEGCAQREVVVDKVAP